MYFGIEQVAKSNYPIDGVQKKNCWEFVESMHMQGLHHCHGTMNVFYSNEANLAVASERSIVDEVGGREVVMDGCVMDILDWRHQCEAVCELKVQDGYA